MDGLPAIGFDVYGTLVDPLAMAAHLRPLVGDVAEELAAVWRQKQLEYAFRRALMQRYADFDQCTREALQLALRMFGIQLPEEEQGQLLEIYEELPPFPDVLPGLQALAARGIPRVAFSNGVEATLQRLLERTNLLPYLDDVVSVDPLQTFKPHPSVYHHLAQRLSRSPEESWLISSNPWDVIGAKAAGLRAAWVQRRPEQLFDPWGGEPDLIVPDLLALAEQLA